MFYEMAGEDEPIKKLIIYGAHSIALGVGQAVKHLYPAYPIDCFAVTSLQNNPHKLMNLPVKEISAITREYLNKEELHILIATPEDIHPVICSVLAKCGFNNYTCIDSVREAKLMEKYYRQLKNFSLLHDEVYNVRVYMARSLKDKPLQKEYETPDWIVPIQVGADLANAQIANCCDNTGDNISVKNANYCELTALYWIWKQEFESNENSTAYYGLVQYRRILDIKREDFKRIQEKEVDVILPFPMLYAPDIREHHTRYVKDSDWNAMLQALKELQPAYAAAYEEIFSQQYFYNYNMLIARKEVLRTYCQWLFPILERTEELSIPKGRERADRYIGYLGESLLTLYFLYHKNNLNIVHTGRLMLT